MKQEPYNPGRHFKINFEGQSKNVGKATPEMVALGKMARKIEKIAEKKRLEK